MEYQDFVLLCRKKAGKFWRVWDRTPVEKTTSKDQKKYARIMAKVWPDYDFKLVRRPSNG